MSVLKPVLRFFGRYYSVFLLLAAYEAIAGSASCRNACFRASG